VCGSAYIDFLAQGYAMGLLNDSGRLNASADPTRTRRGEYGLEYQLALGQGKRPIVITDPDLSRLLQAKGAIAAGVRTLLSRVGLGPEDIATVYLAGGFGMHLDLANAVACGLLPGFRPDQIKLVGNTSLGGAFLALLDRGTLEEMADLASSVEVIELNQDPNFEDSYIDCLSLDPDSWS
jgi:uncharacterized 2Fe-2S/4Fe-4S cluster protein (DUF4445 family)